jgi:hypothetical protein
MLTRTQDGEYVDLKEVMAISLISEASYSGMRVRKAQSAVVMRNGNTVSLFGTPEELYKSLCGATSGYLA